MAAPSQFDLDAVLIMEFYDGWSRAVGEGQKVIEAYFAEHLYPDLPACAAGEKQFTALTAEAGTIRQVDDWAISWGKSNGTVPEGRIYEVQLAEQESVSHVTILDDTAYVFWNCTGVAPGSPANPAAAQWDPTIRDLPTGLNCRALLEAGYSYADAFAYYVIMRGQDGGMVNYEDGNEVPCDRVYPADEVAAYWGNGPVTTTQFAYLVSVDPVAGTVVADYASWYWGEDAQEACVTDGQDCTAEWGQLYYIRNTNPRLRTLALADDVVIAIGFVYAHPDVYYDCATLALPPILDAAGMDWDRFSSFGGCLSTPTDLAWSADFAGGHEFPRSGLIVWLDERNGAVQAIQTQYVP